MAEVEATTTALVKLSAATKAAKFSTNCAYYYDLPCFLLLATYLVLNYACCLYNYWKLNCHDCCPSC